MDNMEKTGRTDLMCRWVKAEWEEEVRETEIRHIQRYWMLEAACLTIKHKLYNAAEPSH